MEWVWLALIQARLRKLSSQPLKEGKLGSNSQHSTLAYGLDLKEPSVSASLPDLGLTWKVGLLLAVVLLEQQRTEWLKKQFLNQEKNVGASSLSSRGQHGPFLSPAQEEGPAVGARHRPRAEASPSRRSQVVAWVYGLSFTLPPAESDARAQGPREEPKSWTQDICLVEF